MRSTDIDWEEEERLSLVAGRRPALESYCGRLISIGSGLLSLRNPDGRDISYSLGANVKLTIDGKPCRADELIVERVIRVTQKTGQMRVVTLINMLRDDASIVRT